MVNRLLFCLAGAAVVVICFGAFIYLLVAIVHLDFWFYQNYHMDALLDVVKFNVAVVYTVAFIVLLLLSAKP